VLWGIFTGTDTGRGLTANIDPRYPGNEVWANHCDGLYSYDGRRIAEKRPVTANFAIWWDGDLLRELLDHKWLGQEAGTGIGCIYKWNWEKEELDIILDTIDAYSNNHTKGNPCIQADILGDWREEVIWRNADSTQLRIYTTPHPTEHGFYTLMHDHVYRLGVAWQNTAYNQPPHTGFYIGEGMGEPPVPESEYM
jgi:rhamnogalacturonan endolyase